MPQQERIFENPGEEAAFWELLADSQFCHGTCKQAHERVAKQFSVTRVRLLHLERHLSRCGVDGIRDFHATLIKVHRAAYRRDVWTAFELLLGGLSMIEFAEAIGWLVLQHKDFYYAVLQEPDLLAEAEIEAADLRDASGVEEVARAALMPQPPEDDSDGAFENYLSLLAESADDAPELIVYPDPPPGDPLPADLAELRKRFPRITALCFPGELAVLPANLPSLNTPRGELNRLPGSRLA